MCFALGLTMSPQNSNTNSRYLTNYDSGHGALWIPASTGNALVATYWKNEVEGTFTFAGSEPHLRHVKAFDVIEACKEYLQALGKEPLIEWVSE
jgi:hypothetical protein